MDDRQRDRREDRPRALAVAGRRSSEWFDRSDLDGFLHRSWLKSSGVGDEAFRGRPVIGICNSWSELVNCNVHLRGLAEAVKRGVLQAGGFPREFPVMSLGESLMKPTTMLYRNLMAMDVEESIRSYPLDGVVLLTGCDKTNPASILGACSREHPDDRRHGRADAQRPLARQGARLVLATAGTTTRSCAPGRISEQDFTEIENSMSRSNGHCMTMGTASTMACVTEALGLTLPGGAAIPAVDSRRAHLAEAAGRQIVELVERDLRPSDILTREAFENAIRALHAISGSTNAIIHLIAYAGRLGIELPLSLFDELCATHAVARRPQARRRPPDGGLLLRRRAAGRARADPRPAAPRRGHRHRPDGRREPRPAPTEIVDEAVIRPRSEPARRGRLARRAARQPLPRRRGDEDLGGRPAAARSTRVARSSSRTSTTSPRASTTPTSTCDADSRDGAAQRGAGRRAGDARVGPPADPGEAARAGRLRPPAHLRRADERHLLRRRRPARRAGVGGRRPARAHPDGRSDPPRRRGARARRAGRRRRARARAAPRGRRRRARTSAATGACTRTTSCRPTRAATSTSCAAARRSSPTP